MASESGKTRRRYGTQLKAMVLAQCEEPGPSVARVALAHGINDNVVHRWRQLAWQRQGAPMVATAGGRPSRSRRVRTAGVAVACRSCDEDRSPPGGPTRTASTPALTRSSRGAGKADALAGLCSLA